MFSSNQVLGISGDLEHENDLRDALEYALRKSGYYECFTRKDLPSKCVFQITENGGYCIGWACHHSGAEKGWTEFQFEFDIDIIARVVEQHLKKYEVDRVGGDGTDSKGFLLKCLEYNEPGVTEPFNGIVIIYPYNCYYAK